MTQKKINERLKYVDLTLVVPINIKTKLQHADNLSRRIQIRTLYVALKIVGFIKTRMICTVFG